MIVGAISCRKKSAGDGSSGWKMPEKPSLTDGRKELGNKQVVIVTVRQKCALAALTVSKHELDGTE